jgi:hypothetical protein
MTALITALRVDEVDAAALIADLVAGAGPDRLVTNYLPRLDQVGQDVASCEMGYVFSP